MEMLLSGSALWSSFLLVIVNFATRVNADHNVTDGSDSVTKNNDFIANMTLTLSLTFPVALILGAAWCYCMSSMCRIRDADGSKIKGHLQLPLSYDNHSFDVHDHDISIPESSIPSPDLCSSHYPPVDSAAIHLGPGFSRPSSPGASSLDSQQPSTSSVIET